MVTNFLIYGLVNSAILMLSAIGFSLTFGLSGVANFAHGAMYLTAGFIAWMLINYLGLSPLVAMLLTVVLMGILGALIYRIILMPVRGIVLSEVISTFALGVALIEFFRWKGFTSFDFSLPPFVKGSIEIFGVTIDYQRLIIIGIALIIALFLWYFTHYTNTGLALRGMAQDEYTALSIGIESDWAAMLSLGLGAALASVAAVAILPLGIISINLGYEIFLIALAVSVLGGLESTLGLFVGSLILGYAMVIASTYLGPQWGQVVYLGAIVIVLAIKPSGLFGKYKELEERV
ncbi:High-affinity branched-chain amino acid transport system permease protein LivH [Desulfosporosinus sp. I2]|uniref:branched-chain amino acid ABC transporter permease n=1 Tax=Desulfosporosinus sp. I2 TaxID=1617025 RepID=UPI0005F0BB14|nr:branched-chain amino acid ABC transporter permease [Desulfosporosinus sp. I2]KJR45513.1 High-affinity branched-chain amino acid transport system permease protein LivH [Desulfosporosinus sp. I2]